MSSEYKKYPSQTSMLRISIRTRLAITFLAFLILISVFGYLWLRQIEVIGDATRSIRDVALPKIVSASEVERALTTHRLLVRRGAQTNDFRQLAAIERTLREAEDGFESNLVALRTDLESVPEAVLADEALMLWKSYLEAVEDVRRLSEQGELRQASARLDGEAELAASQLFEALHELVNLTRTESELISAQVENQYDTARKLTILIIIAALLGTLLATLWTARAISSPLLQITQALRRLSDGQSTAAIPPLSGRRDEIGALAKAANAYRDNLIETRTLADDLSHERTRLHTTVQNMPLALGMFDTHGELIVSNDAFHDIFHLPADFETTNSSQRGILREIGKSFMPEAPNRFAEGVLNIVAEKKSQAEVWRTREMRSISVNVQPTPEGWMLIGEEVTEQERIRARSEQAERQSTIGLLTGGVAHDFNNLLAVIMGNQELLRDGLSDPDDLELVDATITAATRGADLTQSMLSFAQKARLTPRDLDLGELVNEMRSLFERTLPSSIEVRVDIQNNLWPVHADPSATENALLNLILNARDAMPQGGTLTVKLENQIVEGDDATNAQNGLSTGKYVELTVMDTGNGIAPEHIEKIFEPFFTTKGPGAGSGLGLSRIHGFMKQSCGKVVVGSTLNKGTMFCLWFPAVTLLDTAPSTGDRFQTNPELVGKRILVAEDDHDVRKIIVTILEKAQCIVTSASNGVSALKKFEANPDFDLLLTDAMMPGGLLGGELIETVQQIDPDLPTILLSGYADFDAEEDQNKINVLKLRKPISRVELIAKVAQAIPKPSDPAATRGA